MNNYDYQMFSDGNLDGFTDVFLQESMIDPNVQLFNNSKTNNMPNNMPNNMSNMNNMSGNFNMNNMGNMNNMTNMTTNSNLFSPSEGFTKGNMFRNLYEPFMNYTPMRLTPKNAQEEALLNLDQMHFAMHELNLYLDNYPQDKAMISKFNEFRKAYEQLLNDYQSKYGPIEITSPYMTTSPFAWTNDVWPWDRRNF